MAIFFYNIFLVLFKTGVHIASLFDKKAKKWVAGRKNIFEKLQDSITHDEKIIWVHCASLGEFEQGRPIIERLKAEGERLKAKGSTLKAQGTSDEGQGYKILLTFFSPSGYEVQKDYKGADWVFYLPVDGPRNAKRFLEIVKPSLVIFVKYEFWFYYLKKIKYRNIPLLLVSALFRKDMSFFKWYGALQRKMLSRFDHLFVQNEESKKLIDEIGLADISSISGDTRFDRVTGIAERFQPIPVIEEFIGNSPAIVAGSTWKEDEETLQKAFALVNDPALKWIIAPHEIDASHLSDLKQLFPNSILFSELTTTDYRLSTPGSGLQASGSSAQTAHALSLPAVLIIDNIGMLSRLYKYARITFIGGGFRKMGVHNVLEPAVYGKPVLFGPHYKKYTEAVELVRTGGAIVVMDETELAGSIHDLMEDHSGFDRASSASKDYVRKNKGATEKIMLFIQEKRLLTN